MNKDTSVEFLKSLFGTICILNHCEAVYVFDAWDLQNRDEAENIIGWHLDDYMCEEAGTRLQHLVPFAVAIRDEFEDLTVDTTVLRSIEEESRYTCIYFFDRTTGLVYRYESGLLRAKGPVSGMNLRRLCSFGRNARALVG
jgi:hypothetical protein